MFTVLDKILCVLIIENNYEDSIYVYDCGVKLNRKYSKSRYTKVDGDNSTKIKDRNTKGIKRFNKLCGTTKMFRRTAISMELELVLKERYIELCDMTDKGD